MFIQNFFSYEDFYSVITNVLTGADSADITIGPPDPEKKKVHESRLRDSLYPILRKTITGAGMDIASSSYLDYQYQISKTPAFLLPSLTGAIYFKANDTIYRLPIKEAVWVNEKWKLQDVAPIEAFADTSIFNPHSRKVSAFGSFDVKITDVKLAEIENDFPPPPPPAPRPKPRKPQRKHGR